MRLFVLMFLLSFSVSAADRTGQFGIGGSVGYNTPIFGHTFNSAADAGVNWAGHARYHLNSKWGFELSYGRHEFEDVSFNMKTTSFAAHYRFSTNRFSPYVGLGLGHVDAQNGESWRTSYKAVAGAEYDLICNFVLGAAIDYQHLDKRLTGGGDYARKANPMHIIAARVALTWYFGAPKAAEVVEAAPTKKQNSPIVADKDSDNDGVVDRFDRCPGTKSGVEVNDYGCAREEKAEIHVNVEFGSGKTDIAPAYHSELEHLAGFLKSHPQTTAVIEGHTDSSGGQVLNKKLSQARAESVKNYLVTNLGIESRRLNAVGYGSEKPVADNKTIEGKQKNRRVVAVISE
jgi:OOP family OmpA-OmpF porin